ncbi:C40 family peptidase [Paractinoplanes ferrugineus]|uniref:C40 family peptidase n=1 Tax=Paractinoplanes ferrugineus TaxID=113564 RepID=UPI001EF16408|nr:C40 family peptidase [Actinoplanes ferrugineus]
MQAAPPAPVSEDRISPETAPLDSESAFATRAVLADRASRATIRRAAMRPPVARPPVTSASRRSAGLAGRLRAVESRAAQSLAAHSRAVESRDAESRAESRAAQSRAESRAAEPRAERRAAEHRATRSQVNRREPAATRSVRQRLVRRLPTRVRTVITRHTAVPRRHQRVMRLGNMTAVIEYARQQVGKRYVSGGEGGRGFDCSGLTRAAYARAGIRLPHSSGAQAARARRISRSQARPGDLVVGPGHVGIYMGNGMMIDAGNRRVGVVYRRLYSGLSVERL